jgi:hypothetical protein
MNHANEILSLVLLFAGPCMLVFSLVSIVRTKSFLLRSVEVTGEIIRLQRSEDCDRYGYTYAPVFSFNAAGGETYTVTSDVSSTLPGFSVGESVRVRYDPTNPEDARIHSLFQTWGVGIISGAVGVFFVCGSCKLLGLL